MESKVEVTEKEKAVAFLEFQYTEIKDLSKQFLTVVAAVLALSVTFAEKIVDFTDASLTSRLLLMGAWGLCLFSFVLGGVAIYFIYNIGALAKDTVLNHNVPGYKVPPYWRLTKKYVYLCLNVAGILFVIALFLLVTSGIIRVL
ncbi:MAG: hypothetical protein WCH01_07290 [Methylococcaceae bacterium]